MISFVKLMREVLTETVSFRRLISISEPGRIERGERDVKARPMRVITTDRGEAWTFSYKSNPSTTGTRWHGHIQFMKEDVAGKENAADLDCMVDCDCPDYRFRYAYNNAEAGVGYIGKQPGFQYGNSNNGKAPRPRSEGGVGDYGVGLCKHLIGLGQYLNTEINAPEPDDEPSITKYKTEMPPEPQPPKPRIRKKPTPKPLPAEPEVEPEPEQPEEPVEPQAEPGIELEPEPEQPEQPEISPEEPGTTEAPDPDDEQDNPNNKRGGLKEGMISNLYTKIQEFVRTHPEFEATYYDD